MTISWNSRPWYRCPFKCSPSQPDLLSNQVETVKYYVERSGLSFNLSAHIRLLVAHRENYPYCVNLNTGILGSMGGLSEEQIASAIAEPGKTALEEKEVALLQFVLKAVQDPATTDKSDIDALHSLGWTDRIIFDAVNEGMLMVTRGMMFKAFKVAEA